MKIKHIDTNKKVFIVAEIGNNHEGDFELAKELISLAKEAGADAVKFQTYKTKNFISRSEFKRFEMLKSFELSYKDFRMLSEYAKEKKIIFISTPLDLESAVFLNDIADIIKIASSDNNFLPLLKVVCLSKRPIIISTGLIDIKDVDKLLAYILSRTDNTFLNEKLGILHCVTAYPTEYQYVNLNAIKTLKKNFKITVGYSDHTLGIKASIASVGVGARIIEKHFTKDNNFSDFRDHQISANPEQFQKMVKSIRDLEIMLGSGEKVLQYPEKKIISTVRRSIVARCNLKKGVLLTENDINWVRPGFGIPPDKTMDVIGKRLKEDIEEGQNILYQHLSD